MLVEEQDHHILVEAWGGWSGAAEIMAKPTR